MTENSEQPTGVGSGNVTITLEGREFVLRPSLNACLVISRQAGGIRGAIDKVLAMDLDMIVRVIQLGLGPQAARRFKDLPEVVFRSGLTDTSSGLMAHCIEYLGVLANGGRPLVRGDEEAPDDSANPPFPPS